MSLPDCEKNKHYKKVKDMPRFEVTWKMYGTAIMEADSMEQAVDLVSDDLMGWHGFGTDIDSVQVDGADVEP